MNRGRLHKEAGIIVATVAALVAFVALEVIYLWTSGRLIFLTGIPTPGGAPLEIHVFNTGLKGAYAAIVYGLALRLWFGSISWARLAILWFAGLVTVAILGGAAMGGQLSPSVAGNLGLAAYVGISLFVARDWVAR